VYRTSSKALAKKNPRSAFSAATFSFADGGFWEWLLAQYEFRKGISKKGFFLVERKTITSTFKRHWQEYRQQAHNRHNKFSVFSEDHDFRNPSNIPSSFSIDFYSQMPRPLRSNHLYIVPSGGGNCIVFDSEVFPPPYLDPSIKNASAVPLPISIRKGFRNLREALSFQWNEQSFIRALHFCGAFVEVSKRVCKTTGDYQCGPSGHIRSCFPFWMRGVKRKNRLVRFLYDGIVDLDECIYPRDVNTVMLIEAKIRSDQSDLGWHKLAFPCYRFIDNSRAIGVFRTGLSEMVPSFANKARIIPLYCEFDPVRKLALIYVFSEIRKHRFLSEFDDFRRGIILNHTQQFRPRLIFKVDMNWMDQDFL
jgi:hypothetical protein